MDIRSYIKDLLYLHDCVVIPGFGGFVTGHRPSEIQRFQNVIYPPSKSIMFNKRLQANDGILVNFIAQREKIEYKKAEEAVKQFAVGWSRLLDNKGVVIFPDVGKLYINSANVLVFLPELRKNYLPDTFGLKPIAYHPELEVVSVKKQNEKIAEPMDEEEYAEQQRIKRKRISQLAVAAILLAALFLLPQLFMQNFLPDKLRISQLKVLDLFPSEKTMPAAEKEIPTGEAKETEAETNDESGSPEEIIDTVSESSESEPAGITSSETPSEEQQEAKDVSATGNYYVVLGSFPFISDAIRTKKQLDSKLGKTLEVFSSEDENYHVGIAAGNSRQEAESMLAVYETSGLNPLVMLRE